MSDPRNREAEDRVIAAFRAHARAEVEDLRHLRRPGDFRVKLFGRWLLCDVKHDREIDRTLNLVFEATHRGEDGAEWPGWGNDAELDYVCYVAAVSSRVLLVDVRRFRAAVAEWTAGGKPPAGVRPYACPNVKDGRRYVTHGWLVPLALAWQAGVYEREFPLPTNDAA